jgi:hypothetical protein
MSHVLPDNGGKHFFILLNVNPAKIAEADLLEG